MLDCVGRSLPYTLKFNIAREKLPYQKERGLPTIHFQGISLFKILEDITIWYLQLMYIYGIFIYTVFIYIFIVRVIFTLSMYINIHYSVYTVQFVMCAIFHTTCTHILRRYEVRISPPGYSELYPGMLPAIAGLGNGAPRGGKRETFQHPVESGEVFQAKFIIHES